MAFRAGRKYRNYLYISDSKVDMLLPQVAPGFGRRRTGEIGVNAQVVAFRHTRESAPSDDRVRRLDAVVRGLEKRGDLGTPDQPQSFFRGRLSMRWGVLASGEDTSLVYFGGTTGRTVVGLGGSRAHTLGAAPDAEGAPALARSLLPSLLGGLQLNPHVRALLDQEDPELSPGGDAADLAAVYRGVEALLGPAQTVEFLAKRLLHGPHPDPAVDASVLLGSPLYVAQVD
ncbi:SAVMC3_10250 family protein [Streptomyces sp. Q6]|uniref:SAVMC3_10250 family protein n=1 Tax=Streptomyces citrinus TaxID=3118173 RepID=A0ACD5A612_9ACTN